MTDGFSEAVALVACERRLFALCGAIACQGNSGSLWEIDAKNKKAIRVEVPEDSNLRTIQVITSLDGKLYAIHGNSFKPRLNKSFDQKGVFEYHLESSDSLQKRLRENLCFTYDEFTYMKNVYNEAESDPLSLEQLRSLTENIQHNLRIQLPKADSWKVVERDKGRFPSYDFTVLLRMVFYSITVSEVKYTKLTHEAERRRRELKAEELVAQNDWRHRYTNQQVNELQMLYNHLSDGETGMVSTNAIIPKLPKHAVLTRTDVDDVVRDADSDGDGYLSVEELASMFREIYNKEQEHTVAPFLYFQDQHSQAQASITKTATKLDRLLSDESNIEMST